MTRPPMATQAAPDKPKRVRAKNAVAATEQFTVRNRFTNAVQFTATIECSPDELVSIKLGLAVRWARKSGAALEYAMGTPAAAAVIYIASDPKLEKVPNFYATNEVAMADMKRLAEQAA
jgi:hypothetical protein